MPWASDRKTLIYPDLSAPEGVIFIAYACDPSPPGRPCGGGGLGGGEGPVHPADTSSSGFGGVLVILTSISRSGDDVEGGGVCCMQCASSLVSPNGSMVRDQMHRGASFINTAVDSDTEAGTDSSRFKSSSAWILKFDFLQLRYDVSRWQLQLLNLHDVSNSDTITVRVICDDTCSSDYSKQISLYLRNRTTHDCKMRSTSQLQRETCDST